MKHFENKTVFLTGGAQGLGQAYVQRFLEEGAKVFYGDINADLGRATEQELQSKYGKERVQFSPFDVTDGEKFNEVFHQAVSHFGSIDIIVNNAGILNEAIWEKTIEINYTATIRGTKLAVEHMRKDKGGKGGRIINISSSVGIHDHPSVPVYCGTKHAVRAFTSSLSMTKGLTSDLGIEVAILCPDVTGTDLMIKLDDSKMHGHSTIKDMIATRMMSVSTVVDGLFSLLHKDEINGAILYVGKEGKSYKKMNNVDLGTDWPIKAAM